MPTTTPIACSLGRVEAVSRAELMAELGGDLLAVTADGLEAILRFPTDRREAVEEFIRVESGCCPFFAFELDEDSETLELRVRAPEGGEWTVRGLVAGFIAGWQGLV